MEEAISYIRENYAKDLNMAMVSNHICMNYSLFSAAFKEHTGVNFVNYLKEIRIAEAKRLLIQTEDKITEIAKQVGFENDKHFMKSFKTACGVSPSEFRKDYKMVSNGKEDRMSKEKETGKEKRRIRQLARYYIPYKGLFFTDMFFAMLGAAITLVIPLIVRYITSTVVEKPLEQATGEIIRLGILMIAMVLVEMYCNFYIAYYGHVMGARIEHDMRNEIFGHYQKLSFAFFDNQKVGHLLSRITSDLFDISELLHHGPEDIVISFIKLIGAMIILFVVNPMLACVPLVVIVVMLLFALVMNSRMKSAFKENRRRIADINSQIEDSLSGIRVVKSFGNETEEMRKFNAGNDRFVDSKKVSYRYMGIYNSGMGAFSTLITVISLIVGALLMTGGKQGGGSGYISSVY